MHIWCIYTHIMLYIYTVFIYTFTYYTPMLVLLLVMVTDALSPSPLIGEGRNLSNFLPWVCLNFFVFDWTTLLKGSYFCFCVMAGWKINITCKGRKSWYFSQVGRSPAECRTGGELRGFWPTQCAPRRSSPADEMGNVGCGGGRKLAGSDWVQQGRALFSSRSGGNCPRSRWPPPCRLLSPLSSSPCCRGPLTRLHARLSECPRRCSWNHRSQPGAVGRSWRKPQRWFRRWCCRGCMSSAPDRHAGQTACRWHHLSLCQRHSHWGKR